MKISDQPKKCYTCDTPVDTHSVYCPACIAVQLAEAGDELKNFDAFHRWADSFLTDKKGKKS